MKNLVACAICALLAAICFLLAYQECSNKVSPPPETLIQRDTVVIRDTVRPPVPAPQVITVVRYDTVRPQTKPVDDAKPDTAVVIPITRNTYTTDDYSAVVEGYKPRLVSMEVYSKSVTVTNTVTNTRSPRWALTVGPGVGYGPGGFQPYIGVSVGFVLWSK